MTLSQFQEDSKKRLKFGSHYLTGEGEPLIKLSEVVAEQKALLKLMREIVQQETVIAYPNTPLDKRGSVWEEVVKIRDRIFAVLREPLQEK